MQISVSLLILFIAPLLSLLTTTLTYSLRDLSRVRLADALGKRGRDDLYEPTLEHATDLSFITGAARLLSNTLVLIAMIDLCRHMRAGGEPDWFEYLVASVAATALLCVVSLALPRALANHIGEDIVARCLGPLHYTRRFLSPITQLMHAAEHLVMNATPSRSTPMQAESLAEEEILDAVTEGESAGIVDPRQRELLESVIEFRNVTVEEVMTLRQKIVALPVTSTLDEVMEKIEHTGLSRIPVYDGSLDKIVGVLYARDLLSHLGELAGHFELRSMLRPPLYVPRTKLLRDVLQEFRLQKVHIAIVSDEYGGTAGLLTIEDVIEQIVGDISDEHEPTGPQMFRRINDDQAEVDAAIEIEDLDRLMGLRIPEGDDYSTLGGFITKRLERIPAAGATLESEGAKFTVLEANQVKVIRVRIELLPHKAEDGTSRE